MEQTGGKERRMKLIEVTRWCDGKKIYINPRNVCAVYPNRDGYTIIQFQREYNYWEVLESVETVAAMIERSE